jgi:hypothetical protein
VAEPVRGRAARAGAAILSVLLLAGGAPEPPPAAPPDPRARCLELIRLFDRIVVSRFDHRLLRIEDFELAEARRLRLQAEADCAAGELWLGLRGIEDALHRIGVLPFPNDGGEDFP